MLCQVLNGEIAGDRAAVLHGVLAYTAEPTEYPSTPPEAAPSESEEAEAQPTALSESAGCAG